MSMYTTTDVYSAASLIGQELQLLIDEHGPEDFQSLMFNVITVLEELEFCVGQSVKTESQITELQVEFESLKAERSEQERRDLVADLDLMQQSWHNESQKFMDQIVSLEVENQRLKLLQENSSTGSAINDGESHQTLSDLVSGKQIQRPPSLAIRTEVNAFQTEGQAQVLQESYAADLQVIRLLKSTVVNQASEIRETRKELLFTEASLDAAEEEVCRLTREAGQGLSKRNTIHRHPMHQFSSEETELEGQLQACERELQHLSLSINSTLQVDSPTERAMPLHFAPGQGLESAETRTIAANPDQMDSILVLEQIRSLLFKRNDIRCRIMELKANLETSGEDSEGNLVYGPLPREPIEKLRPDHDLGASKIKTVFIDLLRRFSESTPI